MIIGSGCLWAKKSYPGLEPETCGRNDVFTCLKCSLGSKYMTVLDAQV